MFTVQYISHVCVCVCVCCVVHCIWTGIWCFGDWKHGERKIHTTNVFVLSHSFISFYTQAFSLLVYRICLAVVIYLFILLHTLRSTMLHRKKFFCHCTHIHLNTNKDTPKMLFIFDIQFVLFCFGYVFFYLLWPLFSLSLSWCYCCCYYMIERALASNYGRVLCASNILSKLNVHFGFCNWLFWSKKSECVQWGTSEFRMGIP